MADSCAATLRGMLQGLQRQLSRDKSAESVFPPKVLFREIENTSGVTLSAVAFSMRMQRAPDHVLFQNKNGGTGNLGKSCTSSFKQLLLRSYLVCNVL